MRSWLAIFALTLPAHVSFANGAFPDSMGIFVPADRPNEIVLATNFGLLISDDGGARFRWVCEGAISLLPYLYAQSEDALFAIDLDGVHTSRDGACTWTVATPADTPEINDIFVDPHDAMHILILGRPTTNSTTSWGLYESFDGAATFGAAKYLTPKRWSLESVEIARSDANIWYLTMVNARTLERFILRSTDAGEQWESIDVRAQIGSRVPRIALVDPLDADKLYLRLGRVSAREPEAFGISSDGGRTIAVRATFDARMTGFLLRAGGTMVISTFSKAYTSTSAGETFHELPGAPHIRGLSERDGVIYAATDDVVDTYAIASTRDLQTWTPLLELSRIAGMLECPEVRTACTDDYANLITVLQIEDPSRNDAGTSSAAPDAAVVLDASASPDAGVTEMPAKDGCNCSTGRADRALPLGACILVVAICAARARTRRSRSARPLLK